MVGMVGMVLGCMGEFSEARCRLQKSLDAARALSDAWVVGFGLLNFGQVLRYEGDLARSRALLEEALPLFRLYGDVFKELVTQIDLGGLALDQDQVGRAASLARDGLLLVRDSGMRWYLPEALELAAGLSAARGRAEQAARLFGAAEATREMTGAALQVHGKNAYARDLQAAQSVLSERAFEAAWIEGRTLSLEQAIDEALAATHPDQPLDGQKHSGTQLSPREQQVAALLAEGLTNRQIAERLVVTERTVGAHIEHILDKLGFASRHQVAAWAVENGLHA
jgi:non-specific serine/threonine protein kinase